MKVQGQNNTPRSLLRRESSICLLGTFLCLMSTQIGCSSGRNDAHDYVWNLYSSYQSKHFSTLGASADTIFSPKLLHLIRTGQELADGEVGFIEADPICDCQDSEGLKVKNVEISEKDGETYADVSFQVSETILSVKLQLAMLNGKWRIGDIYRQNGESFLHSLANSIGEVSSSENVETQESDILFTEFMIPQQAENWYNDNYNNPEHPTKEWILTNVYDSASNSSSLLGQIIVKGQWTQEGSPNLVFTIQFVNLETQTRQPWLSREDIGDWGYGIYAYVLKEEEGWSLLPQSPFPENAWAMLGEASSVINKTLLRFDEIPTEAKDNRIQMKLTGVYMITNIADGIVSCRSERSSDMPCGGDEEGIEPQKKVKYFESNYLTIQQMIREGRIRIAYPRGC